MLIEGLLNVLYSVFSLLTAPINIPSLPDSVSSAIAGILDYFSLGWSILNNYFDMGYLAILFGLVIAVDLGLYLYYFVMWILKKIPVLGIE